MAFTTVFLAFPNVTQLDLMGPLQVLHRLPGSVTHVAARTNAPVPTDCGVAIVPTVTFDDCPQADLLCVPGGYGVSGALADPATLEFVRRQAAGARFVTSVCTGAFVLGAAGLLEGRRATTHWAYRDLLAKVGAVPTEARVVRDGNLFTGGGVTAGIDFALTVAAEVAGPAVAQTIQLTLEYDPQPPFSSGNLKDAPEDIGGPLQEAMTRRASAFAAEIDAALALRP
jgi:cyclohexyl-isocyanide hydratase